MKKIIFFDLDNTLHNKKEGFIPSNTIKLIKHLSSMPNTYLGLATGRGPYKIDIIKDLIHLFKYQIYINGALAYNENDLIYENPLNKNIVNKIINESKELEVNYGFVGMDEEFLNLDKYNGNPKLYQAWLFTKDINKINKVNSSLNLIVHPWHKEGADLVDINTNKAVAIKKLLENEKDYKLICVGDGHNDISMIEMADVGIAMENSGFIKLKEKAHFIAPHIDKNELYNFFAKHQFFS